LWNDEMSGDLGPACDGSRAKLRRSAGWLLDGFLSKPFALTQKCMMRKRG